MTDRYDVAVVGGGPAGLAVAASCARRGLTAVVFERRRPDALRVGETLGAEVGPALRSLGAWDALAPLLDAQPPFTIVQSSWGADDLDERPSIMHPLGAGWHVDRVRFDGALADWARAQGVDVRDDAGRCVVTPDGEGFAVRPRRGRPAWGRQLLDASGRGAPATATFGDRRWLAVDRQVAVLQRYAWTGTTGAVDPGAGLLLEAVEEGYWYSAPMADGALIVVLVTDVDLLRALGRDRAEVLRRALEQSRHTRWRVGAMEAVGAPGVVRSDSGRLAPDRGAGWRAVGDAAMATDPLGGAGVLRAFRSALEVSAGLDAPADPQLAERRFSDYLDERARYYVAERRWPAAPFWARRRPAAPDGELLAWRNVAITIPPDLPLRWLGPPDPAAEAWLPPAALAALPAVLSASQPAHAVLKALRDVAPLGDHRLLVGLEWLLAAGVLAAD